MLDLILDLTTVIRYNFTLEASHGDRPYLLQIKSRDRTDRKQIAQIQVVIRED